MAKKSVAIVERRVHKMIRTIPFTQMGKLEIAIVLTMRQRFINIAAKKTRAVKK